MTTDEIKADPIWERAPDLIDADTFLRTSRLRVPGGWLYAVERTGLAFVPDAAARQYND